MNNENNNELNNQTLGNVGMKPMQGPAMNVGMNMGPTPMPDVAPAAPAVDPMPAEPAPAMNVGMNMGPNPMPDVTPAAPAVDPVPAEPAPAMNVGMNMGPSPMPDVTPAAPTADPMPNPAPAMDGGMNMGPTPMPMGPNPMPMGPTPVMDNGMNVQPPKKDSKTAILIVIVAVLVVAAAACLYFFVIKGDKSSSNKRTENDYQEIKPGEDNGNGGETPTEPSTDEPSNGGSASVDKIDFYGFEFSKVDGYAYSASGDTLTVSGGSFAMNLTILSGNIADYIENQNKMLVELINQGMHAVNPKVATYSGKEALTIEITEEDGSALVMITDINDDNVALTMLANSSGTISYSDVDIAMNIINNAKLTSQYNIPSVDENYNLSNILNK